MCKNWYAQEKSDMKEESERVVKAAAQLIKNAIKKFEHETESYPTVNDITSPENELVPELLKVFIKELVKSPIMQTTLPKLHLVQPNLALLLHSTVRVDNCLGSKWMISLLHKLGLSASHDEVRYFTSKALPNEFHRNKTL